MRGGSITKLSLFHPFNSFKRFYFLRSLFPSVAAKPYSDESGVRKAEDESCIKITAELCKIGFADAVYAKKISPPAKQPKAKNLIYYAYHPRCQKAGGVIVIDTDAEPDPEKPFHACHVVYTAEGENKSRRYAYIAARMLVEEMTVNDKLPTRIFVAKLL